MHVCHLLLTTSPRRPPFLSPTHLLPASSGLNHESAEDLTVQIVDCADGPEARHHLSLALEGSIIDSNYIVSGCRIKTRS